MKVGLIIFDFNRTLYDPDRNCLAEEIDDILKTYRKKYVLAIVAKGDQKRMSLLAESGVKGFFQFISFKEEKTDEDYRECLDRFHFKPNQCWSIGDRVKKEIAISKKLGLKTIWFKNGKFAQETPADELERPDYTIASFAEIKNIIPH